MTNFSTGGFNPVGLAKLILSDILGFDNLALSKVYLGGSIYKEGRVEAGGWGGGEIVEVATTYLPRE